MIKLYESYPEESTFFESVFVLLNPAVICYYIGFIAPSAVCDISVYVKVLVGCALMNESISDSFSDDLFML